MACLEIFTRFDRKEIGSGNNPQIRRMHPSFDWQKSKRTNGKFWFYLNCFQHGAGRTHPMHPAAIVATAHLHILFVTRKPCFQCVTMDKVYSVGTMHPLGLVTAEKISTGLHGVGRHDGQWFVVRRGVRDMEQGQKRKGPIAVVLQFCRFFQNHGIT